MNLIVNVTQSWGIGCQDRLLVSIPADLKRFRQLTTGKTVILGRKTLATFPGGRPLKNRANLILSTRMDRAEEGAAVFRSLDALLQAVKELPEEDVWVLGGASVYRQLLPYCRKAFLTRTFTDPPADAFFPDLTKLENWTLVHTSPIYEEDGVRFQYQDYVNNSPRPIVSPAPDPVKSHKLIKNFSA